MIKKLLFILLFIPYIVSGQLLLSSAVYTPGNPSQETPDPPMGDTAIFESIWVESFDNWELDDAVRYYELANYWETEPVTSAADSTGLGYAGQEYISIEYFPDFDSATNTGDSGKVWMVRMDQGVIISPWHTGFDINPIVADNDTGPIWMHYPIIPMPNYEWDAGEVYRDANGGDRSKGKFPGIQGDLDYYYGDNTRPIQLDEVYGIGQAWEDLDSILKFNWYAWYPDRDTVSITYGETTPWYKNPYETHKNFDWTDINNSGITDTIQTWVSLHLVPNTFTGGTANADGHLEAFINGRYAAGIYNKQMVTHEGAGLTCLRWYFFHNGLTDNDTDNQFSKNVWMAFPGIAVTRYKEASNLNNYATYTWGDTITLPNIDILDNTN